MGRTLDEDDVLKEIDRWIGYLDEDMITRIKISIKKIPSSQPYTEAEIQKMQDLEQAEIEKAFELGREEGRKEAQPEQRWIPCSSGEMPEECGDYLVSIKRIGWNCEEYVENDIAYWDDLEGFHKADVVTAWCELPEPYREEGEVDD